MHCLVRLKQGLWALADDIEPVKIPEYLTAPFPSYISLQSALYYHGMISRIPECIYAVSLARTRTYKTSITTVSIHHVQAEFFFGYEVDEKTAVKMATPEKALLDICYLKPAKTRLFTVLPELDLPDTFNVRKARQMIARIKMPRRKMVEKCFEDFFK